MRTVRGKNVKKGKAVKNLFCALAVAAAWGLPAAEEKLPSSPPRPVRQATFADTVVAALDGLGRWERAWQRRVDVPGVTRKGWHVIGPLPPEVSTEKLVNETWQPFDYAAPVRLGGRDWTWRADGSLDADGVAHVLRGRPGERFLLARDILYAPAEKKAPGGYKCLLSLEKGAYSEWLPGRNKRAEHFDFPFFTAGNAPPPFQPRNQVFLVLQANARGEARFFFDLWYMADRLHPGSTWHYGARRYDLLRACAALFPDPVDAYLTGCQMAASTWLHENPYSHGFQFVPGHAAEFKAMRLKDGLERAHLAGDVSNLVSGVASARLAVDDLAALFPEWAAARAAAHRAELDALARDAAALLARADGDVRADVARYLDLERRRRAVLLDNPVLNAHPLVMAKGRVSLNANFEGPNVIGQALVKWDPAHPERGEEELVKFAGGWGGISDFDLHWSAEKMLYSDRHHLKEYVFADKSTRTITASADPEVNHYDACYLPNGRICCVCNACWQTVPCVASRNVGNLHILDADGSNERRITYDQDHNWNPVVMEDGRVLFTRWEYADTPHYFTRLLMRMNPDGSSQMEYYGSNSYWPNSLFWPTPIPGQPNRFVALVTGHHYANRAGYVCLFDTRKGRHEADGAVQAIPGRGRKVEPVIKDRLVDGMWPLYAAPYPLAVGPANKGAGTYFLASRRTSDSAGWDLCLIDTFDNVTPIRPFGMKDGTFVSYMGAKPLKARPLPRVIPDRVDPAATNATIYLVDVYRGDGLKGFPRGSIKKLRLGTYVYRHFGNGFTYASAYEGGWDIKKILGEVPVNADGSAIFHVPANTPVFVQPLDADGKAQAQMRSWYNAMPGEVGSCVGCHEAQNAIPPTLLNTAARHVPDEPTPFFGPARAFSFEREIQPVLSRRCVGCHDQKAEETRGIPDFRDRRLGRPAENPARIGWWSWLGTPQYNPHLKKEGDHFSPSYWRLQRYVRRPGLEADYHLLPPAEFEADTSMLVQLLKRGHHGVSLTAEEWRLLYAWIDLNVPYYANYTESSMPPNPVDVARRVKYDRLYANKENHEEDPVPLPAIPSYEPPRAGAARAEPAAPAPQVPAGHRPELHALTLPSGAKMSFARLPGTDTWLGVNEVSNAEFAEFDPAHDSRYAEGRGKDRTTRGTPLNRPEQPVCRVTWREAAAFCDWLSRKTGAACALPTEAEWTAGCAEGGDLNIAGRCLEKWNYGRHEPKHNDGHMFAAPAGWGRPNALGLRNMLGNVKEWTATPWRRRPTEPDGAADALYVVKGGSWSDTRREANRDWSWRYADYKPVYDVGFRVKLTFRPQP